MVAYNGQQFAVELANATKKSKDKLEFLKPTNSNFPYFTSLVEQYSRLIDPDTEFLGRLDGIEKDVIARAEQRLKWNKYQQEELKYRSKTGETVEKDLEDDGIDWHDFIVV